MKRLAQLEQVNEVFYGFRDAVKETAVRDACDQGCTTTRTAAGTPRETRKFYEDFLGLPLVQSLWIKESKSGRRTDTCSPSTAW